MPCSVSRLPNDPAGQKKDYRPRARGTKRRLSWGSHPPLRVAFEGEFDQALDKVLVGQAARGPELGVDARRGKTGDGVDLVEEQPVRAALQKEVNPRHAGGVHGLEGGARHAAYLF